MTKYEKWLLENKVPKYKGLGGGYESCNITSFRFLSSYKPGNPLPEPIIWREEAIKQFSFAILDSKMVEELKNHGPYLEVGCGTGYWAYELMKAGIEVIPTDPNPYSCISSRLQTAARHVPIDSLGALEALDKFGYNRTLLTVWPSYEGEWIADALEKYETGGGRKVVYVGEGSSGCCACDRFFDILYDEKKWKQEVDLKIPHWFGISDRLEIYTRVEQRRHLGVG